MPTNRHTDNVRGTSHDALRTESVFPLRLSAFENYMFADDRPSHPMAFVIEIPVSGDLQPDVMHAAVNTSAGMMRNR